MRVSFVTQLIIAIAALTSCQKELQDPAGGGTPPSQGEKHLVKVLYHQQKDLYIDSFAYDAQNRVTRWVQTNYDSTLGSNPPPDIYFFDFYYNGSETFPYKITDTSQGRDLVWYILYDGQHHKTADSFFYRIEKYKQVSYYTYNGNTINAVTTGVYNGTEYEKSIDTFDFNGQNCTRYRSFVSQMGSPTWWQWASTFDTGMNPYTTLNIASSVLFGANGTIGDYTGLNKNNQLTVAFSNSNGATGNDTQTNQYGNDGYLLSSIYLSPGNPSASGPVEYVYNR